MKLVKFITRQYTLLEHSLIAESVMKKNTSIPGIYYNLALDISRKGLIDIYTTPEDIKRNKNWVIAQAKKDPNFVTKMLKQGLLETKKLVKLPVSLLKRINYLTNKELIEALCNLKKKFFNYSGYIDFTHYLGQSGIKLNKENLKRFSDFHEYRKEAFMSYLKFLKKFCQEIAKNKGLKSKDLDYLSLSEVVKLIQGKLTSKEVDKLQKERRKRYILIFSAKKEIIISKGFKKELQKIKKQILEETPDKEIRGTAINNGIVRGEVKIINQKTPLSEIIPGKIIVTQMTHPEMTPLLRKVRAIITDEGGLLCHVANIAREFGIIVIIGTKIATKVLKDGDLVEVDAGKGIVNILNKDK